MKRAPKFIRIFLWSAVALIGVWLSGVRLFAFPGKSMMPTLMPDDYFVGMTGLWRYRTPQRFDMMIFDVPPTSKWAERKIPWMKRLVGLPGEHVRVSGAELYINEQKVDSPMLHTGRTAGQESDVDVTLGADEFFVLGDNLDHSFDDSRSMGKISKSLTRGFVAWVIHRPKIKEAEATH